MPSLRVQIENKLQQSTRRTLGAHLFTHVHKLSAIIRISQNYKFLVRTFVILAGSFRFLNNVPICVQAFHHPKSVCDYKLRCCPQILTINKTILNQILGLIVLPVIWGMLDLICCKFKACFIVNEQTKGVKHRGDGLCLQNIHSYPYFGYKADRLVESQSREISKRWGSWHACTSAYQ